MLVLSRKTSECIRIGSTIELTVLSIHGSRVRLGFAAPKEVPICRKELAARLEAVTPEHRPRQRPATFSAT